MDFLFGDYSWFVRYFVWFVWSPLNTIHSVFIPGHTVSWVDEDGQQKVHRISTHFDWEGLGTFFGDVVAILVGIFVGYMTFAVLQTLCIIPLLYFAGVVLSRLADARANYADRSYDIFQKSLSFTFGFGVGYIILRMMLGI